MAEVKFHPLRMVAFWDSQADEAHPCPYESRGQCCPHRLHLDDPAWVPYSETVERDMSAVLEVVFPHAGVHVYLK